MCCPLKISQPTREPIKANWRVTSHQRYCSWHMSFCMQWLPQLDSLLRALGVTGEAAESSERGTKRHYPGHEQQTPHCPLAGLKIPTTFPAAGRECPKSASCVRSQTGVRSPSARRNPAPPSLQRCSACISTSPSRPFLPAFTLCSLSSLY